MTDTKPLTPTEDLILGVLAARYRLGETLWTFTSKVERSVESLAARGMVVAMSGVTEKTCRAYLTDEGKAYVLSATYRPPRPLAPTAKDLAKAIARHRLPGTRWKDLADETRTQFTAEATSVLGHLDT